MTSLKNNPFEVIEEEIIQELMKLMKEKKNTSQRGEEVKEIIVPDLDEAA